MARLLVYLFDLVFAVLLAWTLSRLLRRLFGVSKVFVWHFRSGAPREGQAAAPPGETARDPVCGMFVSTELSHRLTQGGETLHFCSRDCLERYKKSPAALAG